MRRLASEVIRSLEQRVTRLERQANDNHPAMQAVRGLEGTRLLGYTLKEGISGASFWSKGDDEIYITYDGKATTFYFNREDDYGDREIVGAVNIGRGGNDSVESDFLKASKSILSKL